MNMFPYQKGKVCGAQLNGYSVIVTFVGNPSGQWAGNLCCCFFLVNTVYHIPIGSM